MEPIKIFKGNDTNFNDGKFLTFIVTSDIDLSDFTGIFTLGSFSKPGSLADGKMEVIIPAAVTAQLPLGCMNGIFQLVDTKMRVATVSNTIPFLITSEVFTPTADVVDLETPEGYPVNLTMQVGFAGGNYNDLNNLPSINGVTLTGNKTAADLGLVDGSVVQQVQDNLDAHIADISNPHQVTKAQVGLGNVDNTSDLEKPISTATQTALNAKQATLTSSQLQAVDSGITSTEVAQIGTNADNIGGINSKIPTQASASNQLADKDFVNSSINAVAAFYITSDTQGDPFATRAALVAGPWYFRGELRTPTQNDYALVTADETHDDKTSRFMYDGNQWVWQYDLNNTTFTAAQIAAINSGITSALVTQIGTNQTDITTLQNAAENNYTKTNLVAGKDISITDKYIVNGTIVGNPTISSDGILSDITMNSYLIGPINPSVPITSFEFGAKFTTSSSNPGRYQAIFGQTTQNKLTPQMALNGSFILEIPCTADGENWVTVDSGYALSYNTTYWAKAIWDGSYWTAYLSTDGTSYTEIGSLPLSAVYWVEPMAVGYDYNTTSGNVFNGSIDLKECYVKVNGEEYWRGATAIGKQINNTQDLSNYATQSDISGMLKNTATGAASLTIGSSYSTTTQGGINIGTLTRAAGANSIAIGASNSTSFYTQANQGQSLAIGYYNRNNASYAVSVGPNVQITSAGHNGVAVGYLTNVSADSATAIGYNATASAQSAIQLGSGTNSTANTFQVFNYQLLDANGKIPSARIDIPYATSNSIGGIKSSFDATTGTWTVTTEEL